MNSKQAIQERRRKRQRQNNIIIWVMVAGVVLVIGAIIYAIISTNQVTIPEQRSYDQNSLSGLGDPDAPVVIHEFSDFGCTHCADFGLGTKKLLEKEFIDTGIVYLQFHSVGGLLGSTATLQAAEAAYCAGEQDRFWPFHDLLFSNQINLFSNRAGDNSKTLIEFADILDLDLNDFETCLVERTYQDLAAADESLARQNGISGTPSFLVNGILLRGNQPIENFRLAIEEALAEIDN
jgi:protein-disulfide isomerase